MCSVRELRTNWVPAVAAAGVEGLVVCFWRAGSEGLWMKKDSQKERLLVTMFIPEVGVGLLEVAVWLGESNVKDWFWTPCRHGRCWQTIYRSAMFSYLYKTPTPTPLVNCEENIEQNIICYQIYDTVIGLNKFLGLLLVRSRFWYSCDNMISTSSLPHVL